MKGTLSKFDRDIVPLWDDDISEAEQYRSALRFLVPASPLGHKH